MKELIASVAFFLAFFRLEFLYSGMYMSVVVAIAGVYLYFLRRGASVFGSLFSLSSFGCIMFMMAMAIAHDFVQSSNGLNLNLFSARIFACFLLSFLPAYFISEFYIKSDWAKLVRVIRISFYIQLAFWIVTFISPELKILLYELTARGNSVNLSSWNLTARGFGLSKEVNYTTPFMMIFISLVIARDKVLSVFTIPTQLLNSNLAAVGIVLSLVLTKIKAYQKILLVVLLTACVLYFGDQVFGRFYYEFMGGDIRTVNYLRESHIFAINKGAFEHLFGTGEYVFQSDIETSSDVGWVIMYNYGGASFCILYFLFVAYTCVKSFGYTFMGLGFFTAAMILNSKGLLFGPNAFFFTVAIAGFTLQRMGRQQRKQLLE